MSDDTRAVDFARAYVATGNAVDAAILTGSETKTDAGKDAYRLLRHPVVIQEIERHKENKRAGHAVTLGSLTRELEESYSMAKLMEEPATMRSITMAKAKLHGLDVKKIEHTGRSGGPIVLWGGK